MGVRSSSVTLNITETGTVTLARVVPASYLHINGLQGAVATGERSLT